MSVADLPDPRVWPALSNDGVEATPGSASSRAAELHRVVIRALESATSRDEALWNAEAVRTIATWMREDVAELVRAFAAAPSVAVARHLYRLLAGIERGTPAQTETLRTTLFAIPIILVAALDPGSPPVTLPGTMSESRVLENALRNGNEFGGAQTFALSSALVDADAIDVHALPRLLARTTLRDGHDAPVAAVDVDPKPIAVDSRSERVHLRFALGAVLTAPRTDPLANTSIGDWGMPFAQLLARDLRAPGVSLLALPRPPERLVGALQIGRAARRDVAAQLFASNAIRKFRATVGEPHAVISAHRCADAPGGGELRLSLSSPFASREAEGFRCPMYPYEPVPDVATMLVTLLRDCRVERIEMRTGIHADVDPVTGGPLLFKGVDAVGRALH
jgi:hypothetical protein